MSSQLPPELAGNLGYEAIATGIICLIFDVAVLAIRGVSRGVTKGRGGWDDWLLIPAGLFNLALCSLVIYDAENLGLGQHETALLLENPAKVITYAKHQLAFICVYACCCLFPKLVLLVLYLRIFTKRASRLATFVLMGVAVVYTCLAIIITMLMCIPISALWDPTISDAKCLDLTAWFAYSTIPNIVIDAAVLVMPIPSLLSLNMPLRDRIGLVLTFSAGGIGMLGGIARTIVNARIPGVTGDVTWSGIPLSIVAMVEVTLYLIAACLPGLRPLYLRTRGKGQYSTSKRSYGSDSSSRGLYPTDKSARSTSQTSASLGRRSDAATYSPGTGRSFLFQDDDERMYAHGRSHIARPEPAIQVTQSYEVRSLSGGIQDLRQKDRTTWS